MTNKGVCLSIIAVLAALWAAACTGCDNREKGREVLPSDSAYTEKAVLAVYGNDPQRALTIIDSGVLAGTIEPDRATLLRARVYCYSPDEWPLDTVNQMLEGLLESDFAQKNPDNRQTVLDLLVYASRRRSDNVAYLRWATEKADFCHQRGEETEALRTEAEIGAVLTSIGEVEKGLSKLDGVIGALDKQRHFNEMDACVIALKRKIYVLSDLDRYDEVIPLAKRMVEKISDYRTHPDLYDDGSFRLLPNEEKRLDYCDFYTSQAYSYLTVAYSELAQSSKLGVRSSPGAASETPNSAFRTPHYLDSARHYLALFERSDYAKTLNGRKILSSAYLRLGQYAKVLPIYSEVEARMGADTLNRDYAIILRGRAIMAEAAGNYYAANNYGKRYCNLKDTLNKQLLESRAHEYAVRYHLQEEQWKAESVERRAEHSRKIAIILFFFALVFVGFIVWLLFQSRAIRRKNKVLAEQLADINRRGIPPCMPAAGVHGEMSEDDAKKNTSGVHGGTPLQNTDELSDEQLFAYLSEVIRKEKLFTDPNFGRQTLMDRFHLSDRRVGAAFAHGSKSCSPGSGELSESSRDSKSCSPGSGELSESSLDSKSCSPGSGELSEGLRGYSSITEFTRELRLEYACQLLTERPDMSISDVAAAAGFGSPIVFNRAFKAKHEITPTYYRQQMGCDK